MISIKQFEEMSDEGLVALSEEEINRVVDLYKAEEGIPIMPVPSLEEEIDVPGPDCEMYEASLMDGFLFDDATYASNLVSDLMGKVKRKSSSSYKDGGFIAYPMNHFEWGGERNKNSISTVKCYSFAAYLDAKDLLTRNEQIKKRNSRVLNEYNEKIKLSENISKEVRKKIYDAQENIWFFEKTVRNFEIYMTLAENDANIAWKFFKKAYDPEKDVEKFLCERYGFNSEFLVTVEH